ncbi:hypothetical protein JD276_13405 [Leucobacter sp. CSA1]|uniref:Uncharacterized protein n=1 Tax=Leucobacter chromiisoli TaxID=2796471 RepID=A0A934Q9J8_9MICO|nr:hypothetical protein [Leucobacter chromiisoli]MBK0420028.1 hypothetical protein [Leucobacter chromiisoli]
MSAQDPHPDEAIDAVLHALAAPLVSAENYLAGVRARTRSLAAHPVVPEELGGEIMRGIDGAMRSLEEAAATMTAFALLGEAGRPGCPACDAARPVDGREGRPEADGPRRFTGARNVITTEEEH